MRREISVHSRRQTERLGGIIANLLQPGDVVGLTGDLGAGKTYLAGVIAHALGVPGSVPVVSPTFTLIKEYAQGRLPVYHMDLYRLGDPEDLYDLGIWEYYEGSGVCLVEWSNLFDDLWPNHALVLSIALGEGEARVVTVDGAARGGTLAEEIFQAWHR